MDFQAQRSGGGVWLKGLLLDQAAATETDFSSLQVLVDGAIALGNVFVAVVSPPPVRGYAVVIGKDEKAQGIRDYVVEMHVLPVQSEEAYRALFSALRRQIMDLGGGVVVVDSKRTAPYVLEAVEQWGKPYAVVASKSGTKPASKGSAAKPAPKTAKKAPAPAKRDSGGAKADSRPAKPAAKPADKTATKSGDKSSS